MNSKPINVSLLYGTGSPNPEYQEFLADIANIKILQEALDPETLLTEHQEKQPDLVLVDLNGTGVIPGWLDEVIAALPQTEVMVCSHNRDPDFLIRIMKLRASGFIPLPFNRQEFLATLEGVKVEKRQRHATSHHQILAVSGTKGGVGITSIATNLAVALAEKMPGEVMLMDLARPFPHVGQFLDLPCRHTIVDLLNSSDNLDPVFMQKIIHKHKSKLEVLLSPPDYHLNFSPVPDLGALSKIFTQLRASYKWVVIDLGVWLDRFYAQVLREADQILLVTELTVPDLQNMKVIKSFFRELDLDDEKVKVLVNRYVKNYALGLKELQNIILRPVSYTLPEEPALKEAINQGEALGEISSRSKLWRQLKGLAAELAKSGSDLEVQVAARKGLMQRIFS